LLGKVTAALVARTAPRGRPGRLAGVVAVAREHVVTVAALASADLGVWQWGAGAGWISVGLSLLVLDFAVSG